MPKYPETQVLFEQAISHVLAEQGKLLQRGDRTELTTVIASLNDLAQKTKALQTEGDNSSVSMKGLLAEAKRLEEQVDELSEVLWTHIPISVSAIYERIENSLEKKDGKQGLIADARTHFHNLRLGLLNQLLGARMLALNSDLGEEHERLWQQYLERHLGPAFKVLRGGHIYDHAGNRSQCQIDLIVLPSDAQVFIPGDSDGGKAFVLVDQIISVIMVTSNLTTTKMEEDWRKLQTLPRFLDQDKDFPILKGQPWPLCYIVAAQSAPAEELKKKWEELARSGVTDVVPQLVIALDTGFLYCGLRRWPAPRWPGNYTEADHVHFETGIVGSLGLAWLVAQHQGRLAVIQQRAFGQISRFANLLDEATMKEGVPATYSPRFQTMFQMKPIEGIFSWGRTSCFAHNTLQLRSLERQAEDGKSFYDTTLFQSDTDITKLEFETFTQYLRWFRYDALHTAGKFVAFEEWLGARSKTEHRRRIAVFDSVTGKEVIGPVVDAMRQLSDLDRIVPQISDS